MFGFIQLKTSFSTYFILDFPIFRMMILTTEAVTMMKMILTKVLTTTTTTMMTILIEKKSTSKTPSQLMSLLTSDKLKQTMRY